MLAQVQAVRRVAVEVLAVVQAGQEPLLEELLHLVKVLLAVAPLVLVGAVGVAQAQQAVMHRSVLALAAQVQQTA